MTDLPGPALTARALLALEERQARQAQALRDNLRRRKVQARSREEPASAPDLAAESLAHAAPPADGLPPPPEAGLAPSPAPEPPGTTGALAGARIDKP